jgi:hypothetical protein
MSNPTSLPSQSPTSGLAISKQTSTTPSANVYACEQQAKLLDLQGEIDLLLAQIQAETKLVSAR